LEKTGGGNRGLTHVQVLKQSPYALSIVAGKGCVCS